MHGIIFSLKASFSARRKLQLKKKVSQNRTKLQQTTTNNNNKRPFFLPKINKVFLRPILQNLKGRSVLDKFFFENDPFDEPNQMPQKILSLQEVGQKRKIVVKIEFTPELSLDRKIFPFKKGFKKCCQLANDEGWMESG